MSRAEEGVLSSFIDIKMPGNKNVDLKEWAKGRFFELFTQAGKLVYQRGSFGFAHPNITVIEPVIRINPGLDNTEIVLYELFFKELADQLESSASKGR